MGISLTENEARALRDAIRTDIAMREEDVLHDPEAMQTIERLNDADDVLRSIYMYPHEQEERERMNEPRYFRVTLDVPVYAAETDPGTWAWSDLIGAGVHPVHVIESYPLDNPEVQA